MCSQAKTSREHVPPRCLFPEQKSFGRDLRINLIRVPSCDKHNSEKSEDDEFFRTAIAMLAKVNSAGRHQFFHKVLPGVSRSPTIYKSFLRDMGNSESLGGRIQQIDRERFDRCIDHITRGVAYHETREKYLPELLVFSPNFYNQGAGGDVELDELTTGAVSILKDFLGPMPVKGENPEVFEFRFRSEPSEELVAFAARFYEAFEVFAVSKSVIGGRAV